MELFEKIYSCYYQVVGQILRESERHPVTVKEMEGIIRKYGFQESVLTILPNLTGGEWAFMKKVGTARILRLFHICRSCRLPDCSRDG